MLSRFSDLTASVLLEHCRSVSASKRYLLRGLFGVSPEELYVALVLRAEDEREIRIDDEGRTYAMSAVALPGRVIVLPYLVADAADRSEEDPNRGNRGFNG